MGKKGEIERKRGRRERERDAIWARLPRQGKDRLRSQPLTYTSVAAPQGISLPLALILVGALGQDIAGKASNNRERGTVECG